MSEPVMFRIFGDDSSRTGLPYFVYGSIRVQEKDLPGVVAKIDKAMAGFDHEIKWNKARFLDDNVRFVNALFESFTKWDYRCIVVPNKSIADAVPWKERPLLRAKLVFTHLNTYVKTTPRAGKPKFHVTLDEDEFDMDVQQITLNRAFWRDHGGDYDPFTVEEMDSHKHVMIQAADIITGAVAWVWNNGLVRDKDTNNYAHRHTIASLVARRLGVAKRELKGGVVIPQRDVRGLGFTTIPAREKSFSIWMVDLAKSKKKEEKLAG